jgi:GNAT superfamily N-acetyltransferase
LGAWDGETLLGFIDLAVGYDHATLHLDSDRPIGLLRFLALDSDYLTANRAAKALLQAADLFWQEAGIQRIRAFSLSTGYPNFQSGAGMLPGAWEDHLNWLIDAGYRLTERYYCLCYPLHRLLVETLPEGVYTHRPQHIGDAYKYQIYEEDNQIAAARLFKRQVMQPEGANPVAYLSELGVALPWRRRGIGRWLLRRMLNDAYLMGCRWLVSHVNHAEHAAMSLFYQVGFEEISYRGYTLEKRL